MKTKGKYSSVKGLTKWRIAYDLNISPYHYNLSYGDFPVRSVRYYFSSQLYLDKFKSRIEDNRISIAESLSNRFGFHVECEFTADLKLYLTIEKRGFLLELGERRIECLESIISGGKMPIMMSLTE